MFFFCVPWPTLFLFLFLGVCEGESSGLNYKPMHVYVCTW